MTGARIIGIDQHLPATQVTNEELERLHPEWRIPQAFHRTGVSTRYWAGANETALDLGEVASRKLLDRFPDAHEQIDALLFCTQTPDRIMPPNATVLQHRLGLGNCMTALDFSLACSGFVNGLQLGDALIASGHARHVLLVTAETYSKLMSREDRGPTLVFGDGAAATLLGKAAGAKSMTGWVMRTDGRGADHFQIPAGGARRPRSATSAIAKTDASGNRRSDNDIHMNGAAVLNFVKREIPPLVREVLLRSGTNAADVDLFLFHQASGVALEYLHASLDVPTGKRFTNLDRIGNTVSASLPMLLRDAELAGKLRPGSRALVVGFGVGLSWGGCLLTWG